MVIYLWAREYPVLDTAEEAEISDSVEIDIIIPVGKRSMNFRITPMILGGPGTEV